MQHGELYARTRARTLELIEGLEPEDMAVQSMPDASPTKWHLAHTSWFFEQFILRERAPGYKSPDERFAFLFNSYYVQAGPRFSRAQRGLLTRPTIRDVLAYRNAVDAAMHELLATSNAPIDLVELGCHHEMQHQELMLTDLLHVFSHNPLRPAYRNGALPISAAPSPLDWTDLDEGVVETGHKGEGFAFDCEGPRHKSYMAPARIADRLVTAGEWMAFIEDGGYANPTLWLSDGWAHAEREGWQGPQYWWREEGSFMSYSLRGAHRVDPNQPVSHVSYYEADAFARWSGKRLPTETELEIAAPQEISGNFADDRHYVPKAAIAKGPQQMWGDVWEWTQSAYLAYPGFHPAAGAVGEYNGKFMVNQFVLRGGSCLTAKAQMRPTYRNFFYPHHRWQMTGLRLAEDAS